MFEKIKQDLFTVHGVLTTLIHLFFVVGFVTCWIAYQTKVMGVDPLASAKKAESDTQSGSTNKKR